MMGCKCLCQGQFQVVYEAVDLSSNGIAMDE